MSFAKGGLEINMKNSVLEICNLCHVGNVREENLTYTEWYEEELVVVPGVPARVCDYCGEKEYDPFVVGTLRRLLWSDLDRSKTMVGSTRIRRRPIDWEGLQKDNFPPNE